MTSAKSVDQDLALLAPFGLSESTAALVGTPGGRPGLAVAGRGRPSEALRWRLVLLRHDLRRQRQRIDRAPQLARVLDDVDLACVDREMIVGLRYVQAARVELAREIAELRRRTEEVVVELEAQHFCPSDFGLPQFARARRLRVDAEERYAHEVDLLRRLKRATLRR